MSNEKILGYGHLEGWSKGCIRVDIGNIYQNLPVFGAYIEVNTEYTERMFIYMQK